MLTFLALYWPELAGLALILAASLWTFWALDGNVLDSLVIAVPFGCGVGGAVAAFRHRA